MSYELKYTPMGEELMDPTPMAAPIGWKQKESLLDHVRAMVRTELSKRAEARGFETFEEANDFDIPGDTEPRSPHELDEADDQAFREWLAAGKPGAAGSAGAGSPPAAPAPSPDPAPVPSPAPGGA